MHKIKKAFQILKRNLSKPRGIDIDSVYPVSDYFGDDRGTPIDRFYIEEFLEKRKHLIRGRVLEIAENTYSKRFGGSMLYGMDILHYEQGYPGATIIGDLTQPVGLPENVFDCFICTQTFHVIYDYMSAIRGAWHMLKPGGTLLATLSGIAQVSRYDMDRWGDFWRFTDLSAKKAFGTVFGDAGVEVSQFGNCYAAINFLRGISVEEVDKNKLRVIDPNYPVIITVIATKGNPS